MAPHISQCTLFSYISLFHFIFITLAQSDNYIIHMNLSAMPKAFSSHHTWYLSTLSSALENSQLATTDNHNSPISSKLIYTYTHAMNGFSANLSPKEYESLKNSLGYISSIPDLPLKLDTTHSPQFLGLNPNKGAWHDSNFGQDVIIGLVDTGVWPESESFKDNGITNIPSKWKGQCENSIHFNSSLCNQKLIGAKFFNKGILAKYPNITLGLNSTRDTTGHGTHTSSTAAGSRVEQASFFGYAIGTASGIASNSRIAMYKALWEGGVQSSDVIAAIDAGISDGVDVLSISFGLNEIPLYEDPVAIATFAAMEKGVFVSTSAGNNGPDITTLHNGTPWVITVAAGTTDRDFHGTLTLGNGKKITGSSRYIGTFSTDNVPIVFMGLCDNVTELEILKRKFVVCEDKNGTSIADQVNNLDAANVFGAVLISNVSDTYYSRNSFATIIVDPINGEIVKAYIKRYYNSTSSASMSFMKTGFDVKPAPTVDSYSSRGPSFSCPFVLKPDITAPGTSILAAWPTNVPVLQLNAHKFFSKFNIESGTSMACPHVAGVAALIKGAHHDWSPAAIRSAIMTTSDIFDNTNEQIKEIDTGYIATPFALGAGHINPNRALDPGLVYDVGVKDYVNLLCALDYSQQNITTITRSSSNDCSKPSLDLNYPSFIAFFDGGNSSSSTVQEFHRIVTNVGEGQTTYVANITPIEGFHVSVIPNKLVFKEKNEKLSYKLRIEVSNMTKYVNIGSLTWMDVKHVVRSPIVVTTIYVM
ncbi:subtilisin-like protease SBT3 [Trifolium pratense]|uniref:subtilisin-like protease SBT3 n=1 Tax=Trifolium pratense TaxID=57577 RepID=UPI001E693461|nr:subtilisin-like protease SBT3 [Trifolium pratense]